MTITAHRIPPRHVAPIATEAPVTLDALGRPVIAFVVHGAPAPQGSKKAIPIYRGRGPRRVFTGQVNLVEQVAGVEPWRKEVARVTRLVTGGPDQWTPLAGAIVADLVFTVAKPKAFPKSKPEDLRWVHGRPTSQKDGDLDKLLRSTMDGLTMGGLWHDDSRVVTYRRAEQFYVGDTDPDVLRTPGVVVRVWMPL